MPPLENSRYSFSEVFKDECGNIFLDVPPQISRRRFEDNIIVTIGQGDTLHSLAAKFYKDFFPRPAGLWDVIASFNNIVDATEELEIGRKIIIPSVQTVIEEIISPPDDFLSGEIIEIEVS